MRKKKNRKKAGVKLPGRGKEKETSLKKGFGGLEKKKTKCPRHGLR